MEADPPLFAYGTLLTGALDPVLTRWLTREAKPLGPARLRGRLHAQGGYPGLVCGRGGGWVHGVLLRFADPATALARLDRYEGYDPARPGAGEYLRELRPVATADGEVEAWVYLLNTQRVRPGPRIVGGDWRRYRMRRA